MGDPAGETLAGLPQQVHGCRTQEEESPSSMAAPPSLINEAPSVLKTPARGGFRRERQAGLRIGAEKAPGRRVSAGLRSLPGQYRENGLPRTTSVRAWSCLPDEDQSPRQRLAWVTRLLGPEAFRPGSSLPLIPFLERMPLASFH